MIEKGQRIDFLDTSRALLMLLGIPIHVSTIYATGGWIIDAPAPNAAIERLGDFVHLFRMPAFYAIAGFFAAVMIGRRGATPWMLGRFIRLAIPLISATLLILPIQMAAAAWMDPAHNLPFAEQIHTFNRQWVSHLWFLRDLIIYSAITWAICLAARFHLVREMLEAIRWLLERSPVAALLGLAMLATVSDIVWGNAYSILSPRLGFLAFDVVRFMNYAPFFALGIALAAVPSLYAKVVRWRPVIWAIGVALLVAVVLIGHGELKVENAEIVSLPGLVGMWMVWSASAWLFDRPMRWSRLMVDASLTIYLIHSPVVVVVAGALIADGAGPWPVFVLASALTLLLSLGIYMLMVRLPAVFFAFNGRTPGPELVARASATAVLAALKPALP